MMLTQECIAKIFKKNTTSKIEDHYIVPCTLRNYYFDRPLYDLDASINLMPLSILRKLGMGEDNATTVTLQLTD